MSRLVDCSSGLCGCALFLVFIWWTWIYLMYILVSLMARYRVFCTKHVNGERSYSYACTCLVTGEMFRLCFFISSRFFTSEGLLCAPTVTASSINVRRFSCELSLFCLMWRQILVKIPSYETSRICAMWELPCATEKDGLTERLDKSSSLYPWRKSWKMRTFH